MIENRIEDDLYLLMGETYHSNSTVFVAQDEVLLVDAMASRADAERLRDFVEKELTGEVRFIISTHYFSDHMAALKLFPQSHIIAHRNYSHTFYNEKFRSAEEAAHFVEPDITLEDGLLMKWGRYTLDVFHNPGHTMSTINVDIAEADLLMVGDTMVGNMVYLAYSTPEIFRHALARLQRRGRSRVIEGHLGVRSAKAIESASFYLKSLEEKVRAARGRGTDAEQEISAIDLQSCLGKETEATAFENIFHKRNLDSIIERRLFA
jgi:glyoxylase-like metal-dependent hydrolase (beta-lactamase superfamily II)